MKLKDLEEVFDGTIWVLADRLAQKASSTNKYDEREIRELRIETEEENAVNVWLEPELEPTRIIEEWGLTRSHLDIIKNSTYEEYKEHFKGYRLATLDRERFDSLKGYFKNE